MSRAAPLILALLLAAQGASAQDEGDLPPGYPPKMGEISGTLGKTAVAWEFFDYSIGAFDASAWVDNDWNTKVVTFHLIGYTPGEPDDMRNRVLVHGDFGLSFRTGKADAPLRVSVVQGEDLDGPQLIAEGPDVELTIDSISAQPENSYLRRVTGQVTAKVCPKDLAEETCQDIALRFDTDVQMGSAVPVTE